VTAAVAAILLVSCSCPANSEPVAPAQVAAAVATATGTDEGPALPVENSADAVVPSPVAGALSQPQQTSSESKEPRSFSTTQTAVTENVDYQNKVSLKQRTGLNNDLASTVA